jgi:hypothetical protein
MDPLSALSLAGSIVQFVDFGIKLLSGAGELYRSHTGTLKINDQIELTTNDLKAVIIKLQCSFYPDTRPDPINEDDEAQRDSFRRICNEVTWKARVNFFFPASSVLVFGREQLLL